MLGATLNGKFPGATKSAVGLSLLGIVYVISPLDLVPELFLGPFGLADDAGILAMSVGYLVASSDRYLHWRLGTTGPETTTQHDGDVVQGTVLSD